MKEKIFRSLILQIIIPEIHKSFIQWPYYVHNHKNDIKKGSL